jgi:hypothetical protein
MILESEGVFIFYLSFLQIICYVLELDSTLFKDGKGYIIFPLCFYIVLARTGVPDAPVVYLLLLPMSKIASSKLRFPPRGT